MGWLLLLTFVVAFLLFLYVATVYYRENDGRGSAPRKTMIVLGSGNKLDAMMRDRGSHKRDDQADPRLGSESLQPNRVCSCRHGHKEYGAFERK